MRHLELIPLENNIVTESRELKVTRKTERDLTNSLKRTKDEQYLRPAPEIGDPARFASRGGRGSGRSFSESNYSKGRNFLQMGPFIMNKRFFHPQLFYGRGRSSLKRLSTPITSMRMFFR